MLRQWPRPERRTAASPLLITCQHPTLAGTTINAIFGDDGQVSGSAGCNRYFASFNVTGTSLSIGTAGSTKMACGTPGVMQQESAYLSLLGQAKTYTIKGDRLALADVKGTPILTFAKSVMPA